LLPVRHVIETIRGYPQVLFDQGVQAFYPLKQVLCRVCPFYWQQSVQAPKPPSCSPGPAPSHTLLLSLIPTPPPNRNPISQTGLSTSFPLDYSLHTSHFFERLTFIQHRPRPRFRPSSVSYCSSTVSRPFCLRPEDVKQLVAIASISLSRNSSAPSLLTFFNLAISSLFNIHAVVYDWVLRRTIPAKFTSQGDNLEIDQLQANARYSLCHPTDRCTRLPSAK
jgi:hypothetical protein